MINDPDEKPEIKIGEYFVPVDPMDLFDLCEGCQ